MSASFFKSKIGLVITLVIAFTLILFPLTPTAWSNQKNPGAGEGDWEKFNYTEETPVQGEWYEEAAEAFKKTSASGKGPLWARMANSVTVTKTKRGSPMCGIKIKI